MLKVLCRLSPSHPYLLDSVVIALQKVMESCPEQVWILLKVEPTELLTGGDKDKECGSRACGWSWEEVELL